MATKKKKAPIKKKTTKKAKPAKKVAVVNPREDFLLILIAATKRYMTSPDDAMGKQLVRLEKELQELRAQSVSSHT